MDVHRQDHHNAFLRCRAVHVGTHCSTWMGSLVQHPEQYHEWVDGWICVLHNDHGVHLWECNFCDQHGGYHSFRSRSAQVVADAAVAACVHHADGTLGYSACCVGASHLRTGAMVRAACSPETGKLLTLLPQEPSKGSTSLGQPRGEVFRRFSLHVCKHCNQRRW